MNIKMEKEAMQKLFDEANTNKGDINIKDKSQVPPLHWKGWKGGGGGMDCKLYWFPMFYKHILLFVGFSDFY